MGHTEGMGMGHGPGAWAWGEAPWGGAQGRGHMGETARQRQRTWLCRNAVSVQQCSLAFEDDEYVAFNNCGHVGHVGHGGLVAGLLFPEAFPEEVDVGSGHDARFAVRAGGGFVLVPVGVDLVVHVMSLWQQLSQVRQHNQ